MPNQIPGKGNYNFIDLFAGAGGLSEGFIQAGFNPIAHVEMNAFAAQTLITRSAYYYLKQTDQLDIYYHYLRGDIAREDFLKIIPNRIVKTVICETMSDDTLPGIFKTIDGIMKIRNIQSVDVVVGGPPCQAYSLVGRAQSSHMSRPMSEDPRNELYKLYARVLKRYQPRMFVFENVMGISSANEGTTFKNLTKYLRRVGYEIEWHEQNSKDFGVLQNRRRMIIVGWLKNSGMNYPTLVDWKDQMIVSISHQIDSGTIKPYDGKCAPDIIKIKSRDKKQPDFKEHRLIEYFEKRAETNYTLSSVHGVKGETFDATLLIVDSTRGANTLTPAVLNSGNLNTELIRIAYVAMTRPRKLLVVSVPKTKTTLSRFSTALWDYQEL